MRLGRFETLRELGAGGFGRVVLARTAEPALGLATGTEVAIKVVHPHLLERPGIIERFRREADVGRRIHHRNVVRVYGVEAVQDAERTHHLLVMEFVEGQTLGDLLREMPRVPEQICRHVGAEVARGLTAIHDAGAVHRDLKPENILITPDHAVKIMDLGAARLADEAIRLSTTGTFVGSIAYAAPEQLRGDGEDIGAATDLYALGLILFEVGAGRGPFPAGDLRRMIRAILKDTPPLLTEIAPHVSPFLAAAVSQLLRKDADARFPSADALAEALEQGEDSQWWQRREHGGGDETIAIRRMTVERATRVVGRDDELDRLQRAFAEANEGHGRSVLIEGEAGIGKSRLVDALVERLRADGAAIDFIFGGHGASGAATAVGALTDALAARFAGSDVIESLERHLSETPMLVPAFAALLRGDAPPPDAAPLTTATLPGVFVRIAQSLSEHRTVVLLVEDLHLAADDGRSHFLALARGIEASRILLLGTARPGLPDGFTLSIDRLTQASRLTLRRLGPRDLGQLLADALGSEVLANDIEPQVARKSDGNPLFALEILRGLDEAGRIHRDDSGRFVATEPIHDVTVPSTIVDLVLERLSGLPRHDRDLLDLAACAGLDFDPLLIGEALERPRIPLLKQLAHLEDEHRLVRGRGRRYVFDHHQIREALYDRLSPLLREEYHALLAATLARRAAGDYDGGAHAEIAHHWVAAQRSDEAAPHIEPALAHLEARHERAAVVALVRDALVLPGAPRGPIRAQLMLTLGRNLGYLGKRREQGVVADQVVELADELADNELRTMARLAFGNLLRVTSKYEAALAAYQEAEKIAREGGERSLEGTSASHLGFTLAQQGRNAEAVVAHERAVALLDDAGDDAARAAASIRFGNTLRSVGRLDEALVHHRRGLEQARSAGDRHREQVATNSYGNDLMNLGRIDESREWHERARDMAREIGNRNGEMVATLNLGTDLFQLGRFDEARVCHEAARRLARELGSQAVEANSQRYIAAGLHAKGRLLDSLEARCESLELHRAIGALKDEGYDVVNRARLYLQLGNPESAERDLERGAEIVAATGSKRLTATVTALRGSLASVRGNEAYARECTLEAIEEYREAGHGGEVAHEMVGLAADFAREGETEQARKWLGQARRTLDGEGTPLARLYLVAVTAHVDRLDSSARQKALLAYAETRHRIGVTSRMSLLATLHDATGEPTLAAEANQILDEVLARVPEETAQKMLANYATYRRVRAMGGDT